MSSDFLSTGGDMGRLIGQKDWSKHALGSVDSWPQSLRSSLSICLHSQFPMAIYWGKDMILLYNDAWSPILGDKHPSALGKPAKEVWSDIWPLIKNSMEYVLETGKGTLSENALLPMHRRGYIEECYFDYTFNPIYGDNNQVEGILNIGSEVTERTLAERRSLTLRNLSQTSITAESPEAACILAANELGEAQVDLPFALLYLLNDDKQSLRLAGGNTIDVHNDLTPRTINLDNEQNILPFKQVVETKKEQLIEGLGDRYDLPSGPWDEPGKDVILVAIIHGRTRDLLGVLVAGISPRLKYNSAYKVFLRQVAEQTSVAISSATDLSRKLFFEGRNRDAREQIQAALSSTMIGIWSWDIARNIVMADRNLAAQFGIETKEAQIGLPLERFTDMIHPDDRKWVTKKINEAVRKSKFFEAEYRIQTQHGTRWVFARGNVQDGPDGKPARFPGVIIDITDRKEIEQELASSERMFNALFESSIIGVATATLDGRVHEANETFLKMFGYTKKDLAKGFHSSMITPPKSRSVTKNIYDALKTKGEVEPTEKQYIRKDGVIIPTLVGAVMIPGSSDRFIAFMLDISEQKQLLELNKAKDEFISIASHQLRTPATGVKQYLGMLLEGYAGEINQNQKQILKTAYESNERQLTIVNDLLRVAQADASEIKLVRETVNMVDLIDDVIDEQAKKFEAKNQSISFEHSKRTVNAQLDPFYVRMIFENIIDNAHKYTPEGKHVAVKLSSTTKKVVIRIQDHGVGVRKRDMPKLFKKFSRIDNPLSDEAGGTGLGLYWVRKIIDLHKGTIEVYSTYKVGTEFVITLPIGDTENHDV